MLLRHFDAEQSGPAADVAERFVWRKIELVRKGFEIDPGEAGHPAEKVFELGWIGVERLEDAFTTFFGFVLRLPGAE